MCEVKEDAVWDLASQGFKVRCHSWESTWNPYSLPDVTATHAPDGTVAAPRAVSTPSLTTFWARTKQKHKRQVNKLCVWLCVGYVCHVCVGVYHLCQSCMHMCACVCVYFCHCMSLFVCLGQAKSI
jgi:hypothetical protein